MMLPYGLHNIDQEDIDAVVNVLKSDWLTGGEAITRFEASLGRLVSSSHVLACSNGTTALHLAMLGLGIGEGDVVFVPAITFLASANAARYVGAHVVFVDVDPTTGLMTADTLQEAIDKYQKQGAPLGAMRAVINVHLAGQCHDLEALFDLAKHYNLYVIEDAAHALGTRFQDEHGIFSFVGQNKYCDVTTFSFHPVKTITTGEGGAVTTKHKDVFQRMALYRSHGMIKDEAQWQNSKGQTGQDCPWYYEMQDLGYNYRMSDINAALGDSQLKKLASFKEERQKQVAYYDTCFQDMERLSCMRRLPFSDTSWHLYVSFWDFNKQNRGEVMNKLKEHGVGTQVHYIPLYHQPYYQNLYGHINLEGADEYYASCLSLPLYPRMTRAEQDHVVHTLKSLQES